MTILSGNEGAPPDAESLLFYFNIPFCMCLNEYFSVVL